MTEISPEEIFLLLKAIKITAGLLAIWFLLGIVESQIIKKEIMNSPSNIEQLQLGKSDFVYTWKVYILTLVRLVIMVGIGILFATLFILY